jgi:protein-S-isoprenylcysteine O-methyltransferase Ste14
MLLGSVLLLAGLVAAVLVFARVRSDYQSRGRLSTPIAVLQVAYFCGYALSSYAFLDSRLSHIGARGILLALAIVLMICGLAAVALSMPFLGRRSFGSKVGSLRTTGIYHYSRNPQLVGSFLFILGYAMLWPSWLGAAWAAVWIWIARLMVKAEEAHLEATFGDEYRRYCWRTPRYVGLPGRRRGRPRPSHS